mmetsp:Transcript_79192/g.220156  ORF Transcript_79192/g.220156 Transcript_79192/m.220156 type:complete len:470 (-) Transcript_79192:37-1446(-)
MGDLRWKAYFHRLHYRWSQVEADHSSVSVGSPFCPLPNADRTLHLDEGREYSRWPSASSECPLEKARFSACASVYRTIDYNTFCKNGCLKLTEVEIFFLSSKMTRKSSSEWAVVYLGVGNGERFRYLRDDFFPGLSVIAFDPFDDHRSDKKDALRNAKLWNDDGTGFLFEVRCFVESDVAWIRERLEGKKLVLISDIRGVAFLEDGSFDKGHDQDLQWRAIELLRPESSLVKFAAPDTNAQFYDYAPGVLLKQVFCYYGTREVRLMIDGVPQHFARYNGWELYSKMAFHHEHLRGQVYESKWCRPHTACLDSCFDCTVLWDTLSTYAAKNQVDPDEVLGSILKNHVYTPSGGSWTEGGWENFSWIVPSSSQRWLDVQWALQRGRLMEATCALEVVGEDDAAGLDWANIARGIAAEQPSLAQRLTLALPRPASRGNLVQLLGSLWEPFTLVKTDLNCLFGGAGHHRDLEP